MGTMDDGNFGELLARVRSTAANPHDVLELSAILESMGITDNVSREAYGFENVFDLAQALYSGYGPAPTDYPVTGTPPGDTDGTPWHRITLEFIRYFLRGAMFFMPMLISVLAVLYEGLSLWAYVGFRTSTATAIATGTILSFLVTGGITQVMGRRGLMYLSQGEYGMARRFIYLAFGVGFASAVAVGLGVVLLNLLLGLVPWAFMSITLRYYGFLSLIWVCIAALYMLQQELLFTFLVILGIGLVYLLHFVFHWPVMTAQMVGLAFSSFGSLAAAIRNLHARERRKGRTYGSAPFPRRSVLLYTLLPYYAYGLLYFALLFTDRVMAWSTDTSYGFPIWFQGHYELGMDWASFCLVLPMGMVEWYTNRFFPDLVDMERKRFLRNLEGFQSRYLRVYCRKLMGFALVSVISGLGVWLFFDHVSSQPHWLGKVTPVMMNGTTHFVAGWAVFGYILLSLGLLNSLMLFTMSQPKPILRAVSLGLAADIVVGFILSRTLGYQYAVLGLVAGAGVFAALSTVSTLRMFGNIAYNHYVTM